MLTRQRRFTSRSRRGCLTCRHRKKKCPNDGPECQSCIRLNLECVWDSRRQVVSPGEVNPHQAASCFAATCAGDENTTDTFPSLAFTLIPSAIPSGIDAEEQKMLLSYYLHSFIPTISVAHTTPNLFVNIYVPMAFECDAIMKAILACSATHLARTAFDDADHERFLAVSLQYQRHCYAFLKQRIGSDDRLQRDTLEATVIILLLVGIEVQSGAHTSKWVSQVDCIRRLIRESGGKATFCRRSWEATTIYGHFLYYDVMSLLMDGVMDRDGTDYAEAVAEVTGESPTPLEDAEAPWAKYLPVEERRSTVGHGASMSSDHSLGSVHPLLGLSRSLFELMQKIRYVKPMQEEEGQGLFNFAGNQLFLELEREISSLQFQILPSSNANMRTDTTTRSDLVILAEIHQFAALILLYRRSYMHREQATILARHIITMAGRITEGNAAEAGLTYPLFLAGAELMEEDDIVSCATKLRKIKERVKVMNIQAVEEVLQEVWRERLNRGEYRDWETVLRNWDWVINLG